MDIEDIFIKMLIDNIDDLRSGKLHKSKFIGKYISELKSADKTNAFRYKSPQVIGRGDEPDNNWLDYVISLNDDDDECNHFIEVIKN